MLLTREEVEHKRTVEKMREAEEKELREKAKLYRLRESYKQGKSSLNLRFFYYFFFFQRLT